MRTMSRRPTRLASAICPTRCLIAAIIIQRRAAWSNASPKPSSACARARRSRAGRAMIDPKLLRADPEQVARNLARRGYRLDVEALRGLEQKRRDWQIESDRLRAARNNHAKVVGQ